MDVALGVSIAPDQVRMVLVEGEGAGGVTVDQAGFDVPRDAAVAADQAIAAILGTRESAAENGHVLRFSGATWSEHAEAEALRNALVARGIQDVALVSAFDAAAALAQAVGGATGSTRTALVFIEPAAATLAIVDTSDGSTVDVHQRPLTTGDDALAQLAALVATVESMPARPDGVFLVGSGVDITSIKPALQAATSVSVTAPEEPEMALARGAALAAANARLGAPSTLAMPPIEDPAPELAYSAEPDYAPDLSAAPDAAAGARRSRKAFAIIGATAIFVVGAVALTLALALGIRPHVEQRPDISRNVVAPATQPPQAPAPPPQAPAPAPPPAAPPASPAPVAPSPNPPQQWLPLHPRDDDHDDHGGWLRRHLGRGILVP